MKDFKVVNYFVSCSNEQANLLNILIGSPTCSITTNGFKTNGELPHLIRGNNLYLGNFDINWNTHDYTTWIKNCLMPGLRPGGKIFWVCPKQNSNKLRAACEQGKIKYNQHQLGKVSTECNIFELYRLQ